MADDFKPPPLSSRVEEGFKPPPVTALVPDNPSDSIPKAKPPIPAGLRPGAAVPSVPTMGGEALRNLPRSIANYTTGGFGMSPDTGIIPAHSDPEDTPGPSFGNLYRHLRNSLTDTAYDIYHTFRHPAESFAQDPIATANTLGTPFQIGEGVYQGGRALTRVDPQVAVNRALRPAPSSPDFPQMVPQTLSAIKAVNPGFKPAIKGGQLNVVPAAERAIQAHQEALQPWLQRMEGTRISGAPIIEATRQATGGMLPSEGPSAQSLIDRAGVDYSSFTPQELRDRLALLNQRLSSYYNQAPGRQTAALADIPDAVLKAQRDAAADTLYRHLDPENEGAGPRLIQSRTGNLIDLRDAALRRNNAIVAEQPLTPLGRVVDPVKGFVRSLLPGKATGSGIAFAEGSEGRSLPLLRRAFNAVDETQGANELGSLPRPGPRLLGPATDTSGPVPALARDVSAVGATNPRARLMLPPSSSPIGISAVTAPDYAGQIRTGANRLNAGPRQLPAASSPIGVSGTTVPDVVSTSSRGKGGPIGLLPAPQPGIAPVNLTPEPRPDVVGPAGSQTLQQIVNPRIGKGILGGRLLDFLPRRGAE
jgi:hypothetical protein